jgi:hypothetical protein
MHVQAQEEFRLLLSKSFSVVRLLFTHQCITLLHLLHTQIILLKHGIRLVAKLLTACRGAPDPLRQSFASMHML